MGIDHGGRLPEVPTQGNNSAGATGGAEDGDQDKTQGFREKWAAEHIAMAKRLADMHRPTPAPTFACNMQMGVHYGVGVGLYFQVLEWLFIMFSCITVLAIPYWIFINNSYFTLKGLADDKSFGVQVFNDGADILQSSFAAILDSRLDPNSSLNLINTKIGGRWYGPSKKIDFLLWVSILDVVAVLVMIGLSTYMLYKTKWFEDEVDKNTLDATDFAIFVTNLPPDARTHEVGDFFSRFGAVIDVVIVPDMNRVLGACTEVTELDHRRDMLLDELANDTTEKGQMKKREALDKVEKKIEKLLKEVNDDMAKHADMRAKQKTKKKCPSAEEGQGSSAASGDDPIYDTKAAIVTFNRHVEQQRALEQTLNLTWAGWFYSLFSAAESQKLRGYPVRTCRADDPIDYKFEHMGVHKTRLLRLIISRFIILVVLIVCALIITALSGIDNSEGAFLNFYFGAEDQANEIFLKTGQGEFTEEKCSDLLEFECESYFSENLKKGSTIDTFTLRYGRVIQFSSSVDLHLYRKKISDTWTQWLKASDPNAIPELASIGSPHLAACKPCYCDGIEMAYDEDLTRARRRLTADWTATARKDCKEYIEHDPISGGISTAISVVLVVVNTLLKTITMALTKFEHHISVSEQEEAFATVAYVSQLLNTVLVLLIVNARAAAEATSFGNLDGAGGWLRYILLGGEHTDFSPRWYQQVGRSIMIMLFIESIMPVVGLFVDIYKQKLVQYFTKRSSTATQHDFNNAFDYPDFVMTERVADLMLFVSVTLIFCSGMPLCAAAMLVILASTWLTDRFALKHHMKINRYSTELPRLMLKLLPWFIMFHCMFGLWQHTYFSMDLPNYRENSLFVSALDDYDDYWWGYYYFYYDYDDSDNETTGPPEDIVDILSTYNVLARLGQPNGFGLLLCTLLMFLWLFTKYVILGWVVEPLRTWLAGKKEDVARLKDSEAKQRKLRMIDAVNKASKLLTTAPLEGHGKNHVWDVQVLLSKRRQEEKDDPDTFEKVLLEGRFTGLPSYRMPHHPRYAAAFSNVLSKPIWSKIFGQERYTRLVATLGDPKPLNESPAMGDASAGEKKLPEGEGKVFRPTVWQVHPTLILSAAETDALEGCVAPPEASRIAKKLATFQTREEGQDAPGEVQ